MTKETATEKITALKQAIGSEFVGKEELVDRVLICLLAGGHVLLEDVPGVGKTTLAKTLAKMTGLSLGRIQFTPDTLPSDVVGLNVYNMKTGEFEWKQGAVMQELVLADEINRTPPKTQSALLEAMAEGQVSTGDMTIPMREPFFVIATQNPVEYVGTYPLPEAQLDRFMMCLSIGYPSEEQELLIAQNELNGSKAAKAAEGCLSVADILDLKQLVGTVTVSEAVLTYARNIAKATREEKRFRLGASTRGYLALVLAARAKAFLEGRDYVIPDDVKALVEPVLAHRMVLTVEAKRQKTSANLILKDMMTHVRVPV